MKFGAAGRIGSNVLFLLLLTGCGVPDHIPAPLPEPGPLPEPAQSKAKDPAPISPNVLVGNTETQLVGLLGSPTSVREEPPAMVWRYLGQACKVDVFFYFDIGSQDFRTLAYKFYRNEGATQKEAECLRQIRSSPRVGQTKKQ